MEFYFVRHGLIDYGPEFATYKTPDVSLNETGRGQAQTIRPLIETLPIRTICVSPMLRARETLDIIAENLNCPVVVVDELHECSGPIWQQMSSLDAPNPPDVVEQLVHDFMDRAVAGINKSLRFDGPVLVVAHGGIHYAFCHKLAVEHPSKRISHCVPVHFSLHDDRWKAKVLI